MSIFMRRFPLVSISVHVYNLNFKCRVGPSWVEVPVRNWVGFLQLIFDCACLYSSYNRLAMKKQEPQRSGVARCQKCFKYGHYTYECQNEPSYRYRPSRTIQYK